MVLAGLPKQKIFQSISRWNVFLEPQTSQNEGNTALIPNLDEQLLLPNGKAKGGILPSSPRPKRPLGMLLD